MHTISSQPFQQNLNNYNIMESTIHNIKKKKLDYKNRSVISDRKNDNTYSMDMNLPSNIGLLEQASQEVFHYKKYKK